MNTQLVKREDRWDLYNEDGHKIASTLDGAKYKLSLKNCEAIANGYDLDKLADEMLEKAQTPHKLISPITYRDGVIKGFQKALELMGDRKFSEEDMKRAFNKGAFYGSTGLGNTHYFDGILKSLQQTEWDVEVTMKYFTEYDTNPVTIEHKTEPKLDAEGCLILKRS